MSRTAKPPKFEMCEGRYSALKLQTDINLVFPISDEEKPLAAF